MKKTKRVKSSKTSKIQCFSDRDRAVISWGGFVALQRAKTRLNIKNKKKRRKQ